MRIVQYTSEEIGHIEEDDPKDISSLISGLEWILEDDKFGFGENWNIGKPQSEEELAGKIIWNTIEFLKDIRGEMYDR